ncbi:copper resistance protein B [Kiloniella sp.]|uniref:copper resistance protein B n=1 Tax=Kiloniella sp. TaxID=1938587 RepID=UPI003A92245A
MKTLEKMSLTKTKGAALAGLAFFTFLGAGASAQELSYDNPGKDAYLYYGLSIEQLETRVGEGDRFLVWDGDAFVGTDEVKFRLRSAGEYSLDESLLDNLEHQALVQTPVSDFFDAKAGLRYDSPNGENRGYAVLGFQGLAPQWFELEGDLYLSEKGNVSARLEADYELLLTNRLILTPTTEIDLAFSNDEAIGVGSGLNSIETGLRLSYDLVDRTIAPYIGVNYERRFGQTRDFAKKDGEDTDETTFVVGVRLLF